MLPADLRSAADGSSDSAYGLDRDLCLTYTNPAWAAFARANGGEAVLARWAPGARVIDAISQPLKDFFADAFTLASETRERWEHEYDCGSSTLYRRFRMIAYPLEGGGLLVCNSLVVEAERSEAPLAALDAVYVRRGFVTQCGHCRRVQNPTEADRWDWVPEYVSRPPANVSHSLCPPCVEVYYPSGA